MNLSEKISVILADERRQYGEKNRGRMQAPYLGSLNVGWSYPVGLLQPKSIPGHVKSENTERLLLLHSMQDALGKSKLVAHLRATLMILNGEDVAHVAFLTLHRLGLSIEALEDIAKARNSNPRSGGFGSVMTALAGLLAFEYSTMSADWCQKVQKTLGQQLAMHPTIRDRLNQILLRHVDAELVDANPEIYADRDKVISIWEKNFGDKNVANLVEEIDQYFRDGARSETAFATCLGRLRVLIASVSRAVVDRAAAEGRPPLGADADEKTVLQHLISIKLIGNPEFNILRSLRDLAATEGAHALDARIEEARLVKNMTYEILLLLLTRTPGVAR